MTHLLLPSASASTLSSSRDRLGASGSVHGAIKGGMSIIFWATTMDVSAPFEYIMHICVKVKPHLKALLQVLGRESGHGGCRGHLRRR